ncbi:MAG TPA: exo-beta-N-acetylmuramidase NamZ domain-containing protein [Thermodesulfobacteriota bacterium]|nr:exo-beta-N-acetylmuramidase NamZ domain-containing protein [Thermodesulfobacteriota bacterium]
MKNLQGQKTAKWWRIFLPLMLSAVIPTSASAQALQEEQMVPIAELAKKEIQAGRIPGAVILIGNRGKVVFRREFGLRALKPKKVPMTTDTIFDIASLTKVIATSTAVAQLVETGKLNLEDPVAKYWPEFKVNGKEAITVRDLLTHYSGLRPSLDSKPNGSGYDTILRMAEEEKPILPSGTSFIYSDINFIILGELVSRISGETLDVYCANHIFKPLEMKDTGFKPSPLLRPRIAPTQYQHGTTGIILWGEVHDPVAYSMGGVAGHAGLFSTADDLAIFAQMVLDGGSRKGVRILSPLMIRKMTTPQSPPDKLPLRGLGWNIDSSLASEASYGHKGFTGTGIWIDPVSNTYVIILTNRVHPNGKGKVEPLRTKILSFVNEAIEPVSVEGVLARKPLPSQYEPGENNNEKVQTGIDVLTGEKFEPLTGLRVGLITNHSGIDSAGRRTVDLFHKAPNVKLVAIFSPEHGFSGKADRRVLSTKEPLTGLPVYSLYGAIVRPTQKMLAGLDALVFDIQDAGARFYTYITTMGYAMEACAKKGIPFYVLDRPNPITASLVQGPILDRNLRSFTGYFPLPVRHGMTVGELATLFNVEMKIGVKLHVIKMRGYERNYWYDDTGLLWLNPSPNLRTLSEAILYPGVAMVESSNVSVGRGTSTPFELLGAPWIAGEELASYLNNRRIKGIRFIPVEFTPATSPFKNQLCHGVQIALLDRQILDSPALGVEIVSALYRLYPKDFQLGKTLGLIGSREVLQAIKNGQDPAAIAQNWLEPLEQFYKLRSKYLLY